MGYKLIVSAILNKECRYAGIVRKDRGRFESRHHHRFGEASVGRLRALAKRIDPVNADIDFLTFTDGDQ